MNKQISLHNYLLASLTDKDKLTILAMDDTYSGFNDKLIGSNGQYDQSLFNKLNDEPMFSYHINKMYKAINNLGKDSLLENIKVDNNETVFHYYLSASSKEVRFNSAKKEFLANVDKVNQHFFDLSEVFPIFNLGTEEKSIPDLLNPSIDDIRNNGLIQSKNMSHICKALQIALYRAKKVNTYLVQKRKGLLPNYVDVDYLTNLITNEFTSSKLNLIDEEKIILNADRDGKAYSDALKMFYGSTLKISIDFPGHIHLYNKLKSVWLEIKQTINYCIVLNTYLKDVLNTLLFTSKDISFEEEEIKDYLTSSLISYSSFIKNYNDYIKYLLNNLMDQYLVFCKVYFDQLENNGKLTIDEVISLGQDD